METPGKRILGPEFNVEAWRCHDGTPVPAKYVENCARIHKLLWAVKASLEADAGEHYDLELVSGFRSTEWNEKQHGKPKSEHLKAEAADIKLWRSDGTQVLPDLVADKAEKLFRVGLTPPGGIGRYDHFTHLDVRGYRARWDERTTHGAK